MVSDSFRSVQIALKEETVALESLTCPHASVLGHALLMAPRFQRVRMVDHGLLHVSEDELTDGELPPLRLQYLDEARAVSMS